MLPAGQSLQPSLCFSFVIRIWVVWQQGGFAEVHLAEDKLTGKAVALKVVFLNKTGLTKEQVSGRLSPVVYLMTEQMHTSSPAARQDAWAIPGWSQPQALGLKPNKQRMFAQVVIGDISASSF